MIDNLQIYNTNFTTTDISSIVAGGVASVVPVGEWTFNEGTGSVARDSSGNNNSGSLLNGAGYSTNVATILASGSELSFSLSTSGRARIAMDMMDDLIETIGSAIGTLGAQQSRLTIASSNLYTTRENYAAARSRIEDADIAMESANLVRTGILQQAGAAVLAQANQQPALAISLLRG